MNHSPIVDHQCVTRSQQDDIISSHRSDVFRHQHEARFALGSCWSKIDAVPSKHWRIEIVKAIHESQKLFSIAERPSRLNQGSSQ